MMGNVQSSPEKSPQDNKLGTFAGVFTPSILTILGIILFMRLGFVVGNAGLKQALLIIFIANLISVLTSLSLSAVATNLTVRGGGDYYLISRTLGLEFGGALGLVLFLAQSVSIAFYCIGFAEVLVGFWGGSEFTAQIIALIAIAGLFVLSWQGADWATRFQFVVMALLVLALASFFLGGVLNWDNEIFRQNWQAPDRGMGFWVLFAVFFPAVTGFTQGVSMSGDLRDPGKSLPRGTLLAVGISILIYFSAALVFAGVLPADTLSVDYRSMSRVAWLPFMITLGVFAATLSSAMASFLGAPRILQSLAGDKIFPFLNFFAKGYGPSNNPRRGVILATVIAVITVGLGNLNLIAAVVSMFFLISYGLLNYATYFEARASSPSFRPRFKWFHKKASLAGAIICLLVMLAIDWKAGALAVAVIFIIYQYLQATVQQSRWADSRRSHHLHQVRENLLQVSQELEHPRDWRPHILAFSDDRERRPFLLHFADWLEGRSGLTTVARILVGSGVQMYKERKQAEEELSADIEQLDIQAFPLIINATEFTQGSSILLQSYGVGPLRANTLLMNRRSPYSQRFFGQQLDSYGKNLRSALRLGYNLIILDAEEREWQSVHTQEAKDRCIDIWYEKDANGSLMLMLGYLMTRHPFWEHAKLRVLINAENADAETAKQEMEQELDQVRISAEVIVTGSNPARTEQSQASSLVLLPVELKKGLLLDREQTPVEDILPSLPLAAMVLATQDIQLDADPEDGEAGLLADAEDRYNSALQRVKNAEKEYATAQKSFDEQLKNLIAAQHEHDRSPEELATLHKDLEKARAALDKASRYVAKAETLAEQDLEELEQLKKKVRS
ncbi:MAG: amino acid permease [Desulfuromonadales bacterium]|nr:amino acid permease [Desulfuromonadales bacterium]MBN2792691.1 amino acid permease [Desulfuromonadales bacterium]